MENFVQPACITKDLCLVFYARDARVSLPRSLRSLIYGGTYKSNDANKVSGLYKLAVKQAADSSSPGAHRRYGRVIDTSNSYVRGEEMLKGWRPRSDSLIFEHQWELEKLTRLQHVERTRHSILLNNMIESLKNDEPISPNKRQLNNQNSIANKSLNSSPGYEDYENSCYTDNQKQLLLNCIRLINKGRIQSTNEKLNENGSISSTATTSHYNIPNINVIFFLFDYLKYDLI
jgi:kinesin family protein 1